MLRKKIDDISNLESLGIKIRVSKESMVTKFSFHTIKYKLRIIGRTPRTKRICELTSFVHESGRCPGLLGSSTRFEVYWSSDLSIKP